MDAHPTNNSPETTARDGADPARSWAHTRSPLTISQAYEQFLEVPVVVLAVLWIVGTALLGSTALVLYMIGTGLVQLVEGSI
jgi:prolipoprotein diacylglyceryltransferase